MERFIFGGVLLLALGDGIVRLTMLDRVICNDGIAFGVELTASILWPAVMWLLGLSFWHGYRSPDQGSRLAWRVMFVGGLVNALDRLLSGCVHDYLSLPLFPSFNLADMMLFLGMVYLLIKTAGMFSIEKTYVS